MPHFLLTSYPSVSEDSTNQISQRKHALLAASSDSQEFIAEWTPNLHKHVTHILVPMERTHNRNLKILWGMALRKPCVSDEAFFDPSSNKLRNKPLNLQDFTLNHFSIQNEHLRDIFNGCSMRRFFARFAMETHPPKFKMPAKMLNEVCQMGLNIDVLDDYLPDAHEPTSNVHLILVPTPNEDTTSYVRRRYEKHKIVTSATLACITEKFFFDVIHGAQGPLNTWNTDVLHVDVDSVMELPHFEEATSQKQTKVTPRKSSTSGNKTKGTKPTEKVSQTTEKKARKTSKSQNKEPQRMDVPKTQVKDTTSPAETMQTTKVIKKLSTSRSGNLMTTSAEITTASKTRVPPVFAPQAAPLMSSENAILELDRQLTKKMQKGGAENTPLPHNAASHIENEVASHDIQAATMDTTLEDNTAAHASIPTLSLQMNGKSHTSNKRKRPVELDLNHAPAKKRIQPSPLMDEMIDSSSSEDEAQVVSKKQLVSDEFSEIESESSDHEDMLPISAQLPKQDVKNQENGHSPVKSPKQNGASGHNNSLQISDSILFSPNADHSHNFGRENREGLKKRPDVDTLSQSSEDDDMSTLSTPQHSHKFVPLPKAAKRLKRQKFKRRKYLVDLLSGLMPLERCTAVVDVIVERLPKEAHNQKMKAILQKCLQDKAFRQELRTVRGSNAIANVLDKAPINEKVATAVQKLLV